MMANNIDEARSLIIAVAVAHALVLAGLLLAAVHPALCGGFALLILALLICWRTR